MITFNLRPTEPVNEPVSKFGGQPNWLTAPQWPISRSTNKPMRFICQLKLPAELQYGDQQMAYIFMTADDEEYVDDTWNPDGGENAIILQPGPFEPNVDVREVADGPTLQRMVPGPTGNRLIPKPVEYLVETQEAFDVNEDEDLTDRIGGKPTWLQNEEIPRSARIFLAQFSEDPDKFSVNLGDCGVAYAFIARNGRSARFLWQCG